MTSAVGVARQVYLLSGGVFCLFKLGVSCVWGAFLEPLGVLGLLMASHLCALGLIWSMMLPEPCHTFVWGTVMCAKLAASLQGMQFADG